MYQVALDSFGTGEMAPRALPKPQVFLINMPLQETNYTITLKAYNDCGDTITVVKSLNDIGLSEPGTFEYTIYPNPVTGPLSVEFSKPLTGSYEVFDIRGKIVRSAQFYQSSTLSVSTSDLPVGSYVVRIQCSNFTTNALIFKQ